MKILKVSLIALLACFCLGAGFGKQMYDYLIINNYIDITASALPANAPAGTGRIYVDTTTGTPFISANTLNYVPLIGQPKYNYIINGDGQIAQQNLGTIVRGTQATSFPVLNTDGYDFDHWKVCHNLGSGNLNGFQILQRARHIDSKSLTTNVASLQFSGNNGFGFFNGEHLTVTCAPADAIFDGAITCNADITSGQVLTYAKTNANVGATASGGYVAEQGLVANSYMGYQAVSGPGKAMTLQVIESQYAQQLKGKTVTIQYRQKATSGFGNIRSALIAWSDSAAAIDVSDSQWSNPLVATWSGVTGTDPIFTATGTFNYTKVAPANILISTSGSITNSAFQQSSTVDWLQCSYTTIVPTNFQQIALAFWSDANFNSGNEFALSEVGLYDALETQPYNPRQPQQELALCQRYLYCVNSNSGANTVIASGIVSTTSSVNWVLRFPVDMRIMPAFTVSSAAAWQSADGSATATFTSIVMNGAANSSNQQAYMSGTQGGITWTTGRSCVVDSTAQFRNMIYNADY